MRAACFAPPASAPRHVTSRLPARKRAARRAATRIRLAATALAGALLVLAGAPAAACSLFPAENAASCLAAADGMAPAPPRLFLAQWRPYGLPDARVDRVALRQGAGPVVLLAAVETQDWGVLAARRLEAGLVAGCGAFRLGVLAAETALDGGAGRRDGEALVAWRLAGEAGTAALCLRYRAHEGAGPPPREARGLLGLALSRGAWTLRLFREQDGAAPAGEGVALLWDGGPARLSLVAGPAPGQELGLALRRGRLGLAYRVRLHPHLGLSHGLALHVR